MRQALILLWTLLSLGVHAAFLWGLGPPSVPPVPFGSSGVLELVSSGSPGVESVVRGHDPEGDVGASSVAASLPAEKEAPQRDAVQTPHVPAPTSTGTEVSVRQFPPVPRTSPAVLTSQPEAPPEVRPIPLRPERSEVPLAAKPTDNPPAEEGEEPPEPTACTEAPRQEALSSPPTPSAARSVTDHPVPSSPPRATTVEMPTPSAAPAPFSTQLAAGVREGIDAQPAQASPAGTNAFSASGKQEAGEVIGAAKRAGTQSGQQGGSSGPVTPAAPDYLHNPPPKYPPEALLRGWQGTVVLRVDVSTSGEVLKVAVEESSGRRCLDRAGIRTVKNWRFSPATQGETAIASVALVPIHFRLNH